MKKLKNKVFFTLYSILTASILIFIIMFNIQNYLVNRSSKFYLGRSLEICHHIIQVIVPPPPQTRDRFIWRREEGVF